MVQRHDMRWVRSDSSTSSPRRHGTSFREQLRSTTSSSLRSSHRPLPAEPYDINFALPLHLDTLQCPTLRLTPFVPALHAQDYWDSVGPHAHELFKYLPYCPLTLPDFLAFVERYRAHPEHCLFAVLDRTRGDALAGVMGLNNTSAAHLRTEIGGVMVFPAFQRTHVARTAVALLLRYCLASPAASPPGLGFRRVQWVSHPRNRVSIALATRMGLREEGLIRCFFVLPDVETLREEGRMVKRAGEEAEGWALDIVLLAIGWDDWEGGGHEPVEAIIQS